MKIVRIVVMTMPMGEDFLWLHTELPCPYPPEVSVQPLAVSARTPRDQGLQYAQANFPGVPIECLDSTTGKKTQVPTA